ncbi:hypothetical protein GQ53DRAFT_769425 [Thozetella sp. PMI_491]|nr:hypothetical protein GQ53DRAFT_769425 [Thozetella sp. PMI_491]
MYAKRGGRIVQFVWRNYAKKKEHRCLRLAHGAKLPKCSTELGYSYDRSAKKTSEEVSLATLFNSTANSHANFIATCIAFVSMQSMFILVAAAAASVVTSPAAAVPVDSLEA